MDEYNVSADIQNAQAELCVYRHEVLKPLFSTPSAKASSVFSVLSFLGGFYGFTAEVLRLSLGLLHLLAIFGYAILPYYFMLPYVIGSLALNLLSGILLFIFCLVSSSALRKLRKSKDTFNPRCIKKASLMPLMRGIGLLFYTALFCLSAGTDIYDLIKELTAANIDLNDFEMTMHCLSSNQDTIIWVFCMLSAAGILFLCALAWFGIRKYYCRIYKYAATCEYKQRKRPPYFRMVLATIVCFLTLNIPSALYMLTTVRWFKKMHAGIVFSHTVQ